MSEPRVDQIITRWQPDNARHGRGVYPELASVDQQTLEHINKSLYAYIRMEDRGEIRRPATSLCRLVFNESAMVVHRRRDPADDVAHVLVGAAASLTPELALRLRNWSGWADAHRLDPSGRKPCEALSLERLTAEAADERTLTTRACAVDSRCLVGPLAAMIAEPDRRLAVVVPPAMSEGTTLVDDLLWALQDILEAFCDGAQVQRVPFSFSTFETYCHDGYRPAISVMVTPRLEAEPGIARTQRMAANVTEAAPLGPAAEAAEALVTAYQQGQGRQGLADWLGANGVDQTNKLPERVTKLTERVRAARRSEPASSPAIPAHAAGPGGVSVASREQMPGFGGAAVAGRAPRPPAGSSGLYRPASADEPFDQYEGSLNPPQWTQPSKGASHDSGRVTAEPAGTRHVDYRSHDRGYAGTGSGAGQHDVAANLSRLAAALAATTRLEEAQHYVDRLWARSRYSDADERQELRAYLIDHGYLVRHLRRLTADSGQITEDALNYMVLVLVSVSVGPDLAEEAPDRWLFLADPATSRLLVRVFAEYAVSRGEHGAILYALGLPYLRTLVDDVPDPGLPSSTRPTRTGGHRFWWRLIRRGLQTDAMTLAAVTGVVGIVAGIALTVAVLFIASHLG